MYRFQYDCAARNVALSSQPTIWQLKPNDLLASSSGRSATENASLLVIRTSRLLCDDTSVGNNTWSPNYARIAQEMSMLTLVSP
jgi:hypothetical protein